jgi:hypothetical protein
MTEHHPLTPPPELLDQWVTEACPECRLSYDEFTGQSVEILAARAAQWGFDQELEACCEWLQHDYPNIGANALRAVRRPKPSSLKEQALSDLKNAYNADTIDDTTFENIRRALNQLPDN